MFQELDGYCERLDASYWAEPVNAVTNLAFILAAIWAWRRGRDMAMCRVLAGFLFAIGVGSYLFHTHAQVWAAIADVLPIALFILTYLFAVNRNVWGLALWPALGATALFFPFAAVTIPLWREVPVFGVSAGYMPVPMLIVIYAVLLRRRFAGFARGMLTGAGILMVSLVARGLDIDLCDRLPLGTHFLWHCLNAIMLAWMIEVYRRHVDPGQA